MMQEWKKVKMEVDVIVCVAMMSYYVDREGEKKQNRNWVTSFLSFQSQGTEPKS